MTGTLTVHSAGPAMTVQDLGRSGFLAYGLTRGGAADMLALHEAAALLRQSPSLAAIEMVGMGGSFSADVDLVIALTGAAMSAKIDGAAVIWNACHRLPAGAKLTIGGAVKGGYGYLSVSGGIDTPMVMDGRASHLTAGVGKVLEAGDTVPLAVTGDPRGGDFIIPEERFDGGEVRIVPSIQTSQFSEETLARFAETEFKRDPRGNRQGVRMASEGDGFFAEGGLSIVSEVITEGDIQITGDGAPYVLMCECQTTGGYPRIGTVIPCDLPRIAQAQTGAAIRFEFIEMDQAVALQSRYLKELKSLASSVVPLVRDPANIRDLLSYQLVGGAVSADADPFQEEY